MKNIGYFEDFEIQTRSLLINEKSNFFIFKFTMSTLIGDKFVFKFFND